MKKSRDHPSPLQKRANELLNQLSLIIPDIKRIPNPKDAVLLQEVVDLIIELQFSKGDLEWIREELRDSED